MNLEESTDGLGDSSVTLDNLYPALVECFVIIICGYVAGRLGLVTEQQHGALNTFVGTFSLPSFIFIKLASLQLSSVNWLFLLSIFLSKAIIFFGVAIMTLLLTKPTDPSRAGLYAIFCTQSNDFAIGYPIISVLYSKVHTDYVNYLYLAAPINLVMLNPFGFILMELGRNRALSDSFDGTRTGGCLRIVKTISWNIITNPVFFMTALGLAGNFIFQSYVPPVLSVLLDVFAQAFPAAALFLLGLRMVGKVQRLRGIDLLVVIMLCTVKLLALPDIMREVVSTLMHAYNANATDIADMSTFGFLYGTIPAAPATFVYAVSYNINADLVASAMVLCTFLSAPLMVSSARMVLASTLDIRNALAVLKSLELDLSVAGIILSIWIIVVFVVNKTYKKITHRIILLLLLSRMLACLSALVGKLPGALSEYLEFALREVGGLSACLWGAVLSTTLIFIECQSWKLLYDLQPVFVLLCWGFPVFCVTLLMILVIPNDTKDASIEIFQYGNGEAILTLFVLTVSFIVTVGCLVLHRHYSWRRQRRSSETSALCGNRDSVPHFSSIQSDPVEQDPENNSIALPNSKNSSQEALHRCTIQQYGEYEERPQLTQIMVLLFFLACSMFTSIAVCLWRLVMDDVTGVYIELLFVELSFNKGQILLVFLMFGLDISSLLEELTRRVKIMWQRGHHVQQLLRWDELPPETKQFCEKFCSENLNQCHHDIAMNYWWVSKDYRHCFTGRDLITWLITNNLVQDRAEGIYICNQLLSGHIVKQLNNAQVFCDDPALLYCFSSINGLPISH
ncbi:integral membrane protein GPR155 homolog anchor [Lycorma delicatula]|uniref:integral membrane protein GPR155 homolog anchor n=1 Tax=Lycorma delicatula TaxID=130591 RepID=UPI003F517115